MLSTHPHLKTILTSISRIPNAPPRHPQENRVRNILGLGEHEGVPSRLNYRPGEEPDLDKSGKPIQSKWRHQPNVDMEERKTLAEFNVLVKQILQDERRKREGLQS